MKVSYVKLKPEALPPYYASLGAAGGDLTACVGTMGVVIAPGQRKLISTGIAVELPLGYEMQIRSRSSLATQGIVVAGGVGTVDSDYRGEVLVCLVNESDLGFKVNPGDRIAQAIVTKVEQISWQRETSLKDSKRGKGGHGSTGK